MLHTNIVEEKEFHDAQARTLRQLKEALIKSFGPMGSNTMIIKENAFNKYSKDGKTILENCQFQNIIEGFCAKDIVEITRNIVKKVGDGTTSAVILAALIYENMHSDKYANVLFKYPPVVISNAIKKVAALIAEEVRKHKHEITVNDVYRIAYISTNGNEVLATQLKNVYEKYGNNVFIDVDISPIQDTMVKEYDGMTIDSGYYDPAFINCGRNVACINKANIYAFKDPVDTQDMLNYFLKIVNDNIIVPIQEKKEPKPTVLIVPRFGADTKAYIDQLIQNMNQCTPENRPPLLIISDVFGFERYEDIVTMCGARFIQKFITEKAKEQHIKDGLAPSLDNVSTWAAGFADVVESNSLMTKFINPKDFFEVNSFDHKVRSSKYNNYIAFLTQQLEEAQRDQMNVTVIGNLKRRINSLKANMVEILVGGISPTDRDADRDLIEDAVLNCRSSGANGYGRGANVEGAIAIKQVVSNLTHEKENQLDEIDVQLLLDVARCINDSYKDILTLLIATTKLPQKEIEGIVEEILDTGIPYNVRTRSFDNGVISSIETDAVVIESIAKILSMIVTANQCLTPTFLLNNYSKEALQ